jgi:SEC-C motif-containing protein
VARPVRCPCGLPATYDTCCGRLHAGGAAATAEALMRARYSAFVVGDAPYLLRTWHRTTRPAVLELDPGVRWTRLEVLDRTGGGLLESTGTVQFRAVHADGVQSEDSEFVRVDGAWTYLRPRGPA